MEVLNGAVARMGAEVSVPTPVNSFIATCLSLYTCQGDGGAGRLGGAIRESPLHPRFPSGAVLVGQVRLDLAGEVLHRLIDGGVGRVELDLVHEA